ncbi:MAG TPA: hypothetical protein VNE59_11030 [Burkholderiales bacterium]|nr:hypothetical protein [Burkholderiales bacterium]
MIARRRPARRREQRGVALLILMLIVVLGVSWMLVSAMSSWLNPAATNPGINGKVLGEAKAALLGYVANDAMTDNNPGSLPCPEPGAYVGTANEGIAAGNCTLPAVGRLPWRTLGLDKPVDASGQPLWYVVSNGWALPNSTATLNINFSTQGQLTVDGQANAAVALIIAPGPPLAVQASANCTARNQTRGTTPPDYRDYLECQNAAGDSSFATSGPSGSFNDQVVQVSASDVMRVLEGPIAQRIQRGIVPHIASAAQSMPGGSASAPMFPLAAPWGNPTTSTYTGAANTYSGLLPLVRSRKACTITDPSCDTTLLSEPCVPGTDAQCDLSTAVSWTSNWWQVSVAVAPDYSGSGSIGGWNCNATTTATIKCTIWYGQSCSWWWGGCPSYVQPKIAITATASNVGKAFRQLNTGYLNYVNTSAYGSNAASYYAGSANAVAIAADGSATVTTEWLPPRAYCYGSTTCDSVTIQVPSLYITDNTSFQSALRDTPATDWFLDNDWEQWTYYAVSKGYAPGGTGACTGTNPCLTVNNYTPAPTNDKRALLVFSGRALSGKTQPSSQLSDYFEGENATPTDSVFEQRSDVTSAFNDHVLVISP